MPEQEGYVGIINLLTQALELMNDGDAKQLVARALKETVRQARQSVTSLEMGIDLGQFLAKEDQKEES